VISVQEQAGSNNIYVKLDIANPMHLSRNAIGARQPLAHPLRIAFQIYVIAITAIHAEFDTIRAILAYVSDGGADGTRRLPR
jgi:hypothetical protein